MTSSPPAFVEAIFRGDEVEVAQLLKEDESLAVKKDDKGNAPLLLATLLQHKGVVDVLLKHGASPDEATLTKWSILDEAVTLGDKELVTTFLEHLSNEGDVKVAKYSKKALDVSKSLDDFYLRINYQIRSWVPLVSRMLPHDSLCLWKVGNKVRLDSQFLDVSNQTTVNTHTSTIVELPSTIGEPMLIYRMDNQEKTFTQHKADTGSNSGEKSEKEIEEQKEAIDMHVAISLSSSCRDMNIDGANSEYSRVHSGLFGFGEPKTEMVESYNCDVYQMTNINLITKTRSEHMSPQLKRWNKGIQHTLKNEGLDAVTESMVVNPPPFETLRKTRRTQLTLDAYKNMSTDEFVVWLEDGYELKHGTKHFKSTLWMSKEYPLTIARVVEVLSLFSDDSRVKTLTSFLQNKLPPGFPVKLEIPVFPTVTARVCFAEYKVGNGNINPKDMEIPTGYTHVEDDDGNDGDGNDNSDDVEA